MREVGGMNNKQEIIDGWNVDGKMLEYQDRNNETIKQHKGRIYATIFMSDAVKNHQTALEEVSVTVHAGYGC
jgi:hypothetical protein